MMRLMGKLKPSFASQGLEQNRANPVKKPKTRQTTLEVGNDKALAMAGIIKCRVV
jgi:hypothetical protein